jgi:hypothetical protein
MIAREQIAQQSSAFCSLPAAMRIENGVAATLQPALSVEVGLAVPNVIEDRHARFAADEFRHQSASEPNSRCALFFANNNIGRVRMLHADDMITGIDMVDFSGHPARHV